jgi:hypothetical protein
MRRPRLEVADIIRSAGTDYIERNRHWFRWTHLKVLPAIARCRTAALGGHIDECTGCDIVPPSPTTAAATGIDRSVRPVRANAGSRRVVVNCCPRPTSTSSSPCLRN